MGTHFLVDLVVGEMDSPVGVQVVQESAGLVLPGIDAGEAQQAPGVMASIHNLRLNSQRRSRIIARDGHVFDVEPEFIEP